MDPGAQGTGWHAELGGNVGVRTTAQHRLDHRIPVLGPDAGQGMPQLGVQDQPRLPIRRRRQHHMNAAACRGVLVVLSSHMEAEMNSRPRLWWTFAITSLALFAFALDRLASAR